MVKQSNLYNQKRTNKPTNFLTASQFLIKCPHNIKLVMSLYELDVVGLKIEMQVKKSMGLIFIFFLLLCCLNNELFRNNIDLRILHKNKISSWNFRTYKYEINQISSLNLSLLKAKSVLLRNRKLQHFVTSTNTDIEIEEAGPTDSRWLW